MSLRFDRFTLDPADRRLTRAGEAVDLNSRYLDALLLLVADPGKLVSKARFMDEVWRGVPVTDEALTQCIRALRKALGDDAQRPRFIETVPKHGYRFIAAVDVVHRPPISCNFDGTEATVPLYRTRQALRLGAAGTIGGGLAGLVGGLFYGFGGTSVSSGIGATSLLLVLLCITILLGLVGAAGVSFGIATARQINPRSLFATMLGGGLGGLIIGAVVKLLGLDAFNLFLGRSPAAMTGAGEGMVLGAAVGLGAWLAARRLASAPLLGAIAPAAIAGGLAGFVIVAAGGHLLGGSLDQLARGVPGSRLSLAPLGALTGETGFGPLTERLTATLEAALFAAGIVAALTLARRQHDPV